MTGVETAAAAAALAGGTGAAAAGTGAALGAGALGAGTAGGIISAAEAAALGMSVEAGAAAAAQGLTAAEVAVAASAAEAGTAATAAEAGGGLLASDVGVNSAGYLAPEMSTAAPETTGLLAEQAPAQVVDQSSQAGLFDKVNYQTDGNLGATQDWLGQKPLGESGPSRGKMITQGVKTAATPQEQQQQAAPPPPPRQPGQFVPSAPVSPYAAQGASPYPFQATTQAPPIMGRPYIGMSQYMRRG